MTSIDEKFEKLDEICGELKYNDEINYNLICDLDRRSKDDRAEYEKGFMLVSEELDKTQMQIRQMTSMYKDLLDKLAENTIQFNKLSDGQTRILNRIDKLSN